MLVPGCVCVPGSARKGDKMWWWRWRSWSVATTTTVFVLGIATVYSQLEISDLDKPSESYIPLIMLYLQCGAQSRVMGREGVVVGTLLVSGPEFFIDAGRKRSVKEDR